MTLKFYQNSIMRVLIQEPASTRFRISQEDLPVVDAQLVATNLRNKVTLNESWVAIENLSNDEDNE